MATANKTMKTRVQLKRDTEANWNLAGPKENSPGFIPLEGEVIIYTPDATHNYSRLKVGDGSTNVTLLPFIDAGTINGQTISNEVVMVSGALPNSGDSTRLYVNTTSNAIFYYDGTNWQQLSNYTRKAQLVPLVIGLQGGSQYYQFLVASSPLLRVKPRL